MEFPGWVAWERTAQDGLDGRGHKGHKTSSRVKGLIAGALAAGKTVNVLIAIPEPLEWNGLPINTAAGLEAGLIWMLRPDWNMLGAGA